MRVSAPGKCILMGEHAAVYRRPALVAAVDRRLSVEIEPASGSQVRLVLPQLGVDEKVFWRDLLAYAATARAAWERYREAPTPAAFRAVRGDDPAHLVKVALGEAAAFLDESDPPGIVLRLDAQIPLGSGFGSSAAAAVTVIGGYLTFRGIEPSPGVLERLALEAERRQHGQPSGVDGATVLRGGLLWVCRDASGGLEVEPIAARPSWLSAVRVFHSGLPRESTGEVVAAVGARVAAEPGLSAVIDRMETCTRRLRAELEREETEEIVELFRDFEACLETLGVVPEPVQTIVRQIEAQGGAAKISGAGALTGTGAGSLLVYHPRPEEIDRWDFLHKLERLDLRLGAEGFRREAMSQPGDF